MVIINLWLEWHHWPRWIFLTWSLRPLIHMYAPRFGIFLLIPPHCNKRESLKLYFTLVIPFWYLPTTKFFLCSLGYLLVSCLQVYSNYHSVRPYICGWVNGVGFCLQCSCYEYHIRSCILHGVSTPAVVKSLEILQWLWWW